ncbi:flagellar basal body P-ring formation chaperone FlgA [Campylobacter gastrosuis]|uniref:Flagellar basal body P-ring formation chaperone FlgA n=1 Tax=Campylobacter gastrosuis TaxID=2974576 RepID=A0ABT7HNP4_9BACT|nr:flagellar basal body P-ring formation chaperone FlgA [Campylobacter gastrosuis]MDL0088248.1 flagellar basal body P-ring formation chaperone FlgA [Campylobacter gastrosuis]
MYCLNSNVISLKTFGFSGEDNEILNLETQRAAKINSKELFEILSSNFKAFKDKSGGSVAFVKNCSIFDEIQAKFLMAISDEFEGISVKKLNIISQAKLPENFKDYKIINLFLTPSLGSHGTFRVSFKADNINIKNLYFRYNFTADMPVLIALNEIEIGSVLKATDYQKSYIDFDKFNKNSLKNISSKLMAKSKISSGDVLLKNYFLEISLIKKGDKLNAILNESGLSVIIEVIALENANLGDDIMVKTHDKKSLKASVVSKNQVIIR